MRDDQKCDNLYGRLKHLKSVLDGFNAAYREALAAGTRETDTFAGCRQLKNQITDAINYVREILPRLTEQQKKELLTLKRRYGENGGHAEMMKYGILWGEIRERLIKNPKLIDVLIRMEETGGEPDAIWYDEDNNQFIFVDCSEQSPSGRRFLCYNKASQEKAETFDYDPEGNATDIAVEIGIEILDKEQYSQLLQYGDFDSDTRSWVRNDALSASSGEGTFARPDRSKPGKKEIIFTNVVPMTFADDIGFRGLLRV